MPSEYGAMQSVSLYIEKHYVQLADEIANAQNIKRSRLLAEIIKDGLENV